MQFSHDEDPVLVSPREARSISGGISDSTQRRMVKSGEYPQPVAISRCRSGKPARVGYVRSEVVEWCRRHIAANRCSASLAQPGAFA